MQVKDLLQQLENMKKGTWRKITIKKDYGNEYTKITYTHIRVGNKTIKVNKENVNYMTLMVSGCKNHHTRTIYLDNINGVEMEKDQFESINGKSKPLTGIYFSKHICDIISIG